MRHSIRNFQIIPRAQTGDNILYIPDLGGNGQSIGFTGNSYYTINGFFDRDGEIRFTNYIYTQFNKLSYFSFINSCILKNYFIDVHETDQPGIWERHDVIIYIKKYDVKQQF